MKKDNDRTRTLRRLASTSSIDSFIAGHVASGNADAADLKVLAELSLEVSLLRERLRYKASLLQVAYNSLNDQADHTWSLDVTLKLEPSE